MANGKADKFRKVLEAKINVKMAKWQKIVKKSHLSKDFVESTSRMEHFFKNELTVRL